ncbi:MAG: hypothetical protein PVH89_05170 [Gammaproteobacteria bacterium]|jgi:hypothetical protein
MKQLTTAIFGTCMILANAGAFAQMDYPVLAVETFSCDYVDGQGPADMQAPFDTFNDWADDNGITELTSLILMPAFVSAESEFDVFGMDIWETGVGMGSGVSQMMSDEDALADFDDVVACPGHALYALVGVKPPAEGQSIDGGLFEFTDCTLRTTRSPEEGIAAVAAVGEMWSEWNVGDAHGVMFPAAGEAPDAEFDFKWVSFYASVKEYGEVFDHYAAGAVQSAAAIVDPVMDCNISRIYSIGLMREAPAGQ